MPPLDKQKVYRRVCARLCIHITGDPVFAEMMRAHVPKPEAMLFAVKRQLTFGGSSRMDAFLKEFYKELHQYRIAEAYNT